MKERLLRALPPVVAAVALAVASREPLPPTLAIVFALGSVVLSPRLPIDRATQRLAMIVMVLLTIAGLRASGMPVRGPHLGAFGYGFALAPLLGATLRLWIRPAEGGPRVDMALGWVSLLATGGARPGIAYLAFVLAFLSAAFALQRSEDPHRLAFASLAARTRRVAGVLVLLATASAVTAASVTHLAYEQVHQRLRHASATAFENTVGLSDSVRLGTVSALLTSDAVVLRVAGPQIDRLRGVVLDEYGGGRWTKAKIESLALVDVPRIRPRGADVIEVRLAHPDRDYAFLPLGAGDVATPRGAVLIDSMGAAHSIPGEASPILWFRMSDGNSFRPAAARLEDLLMPHKLRAPLTAMATEWTRGKATPEDSLAAIEAHLRRDYTYSTDPRPETSLDPILEFLSVSHKGHCEYFASALALLARSIGIPTRMVLGYRVGERSPVGSHYVVRRRNAHAWVEAYLPSGAWTIVDPTPMTELPQDLPHDEHGLAAAFEAIAFGWEFLEAWLAERSLFELGGAAVVGVVVFALQRWLRTRRLVVPNRTNGLEFDSPPDAYVRLEAEMRWRGRGRRQSEPIESWIARLDDPDLTAVLLRYVGARYGNEDMEGLDLALGDAVRRIVRGSPRRPSA
ncbi:MAG: transglutaminaseTgpA domain-containing protein [Polyangiaceae bacterium]